MFDSRALSTRTFSRTLTAAIIPIAGAGQPISLQDAIATGSGLPGRRHPYRLCHRGGDQTHPGAALRRTLPDFASARRLAAVDTSSRRADALIDWFREYAPTRMNAAVMDERYTFAPNVFLDLGRAGAFGLMAPLDLGGRALTPADALRVIGQIASFDLSLGALVTIQSLIVQGPLLANRTPLTERVISEMAQGHVMTAFAITEHVAGSNPRAIRTAVVPAGDGKMTLRGQKLWIGAGAWATHHLVFAQEQNAEGKGLGISAFIVSQPDAGITLHEEATTMGMRPVVQNVVGYDVVIDDSNRVGPPGKGMEAAQTGMRGGRAAIGAMALVSIRRSISFMARYGSRRDVSTGRLIENPVTLEKVSDHIHAADALAQLVGEVGKDIQETPPDSLPLFAAVKILGGELGWKAIDDLIQVLGGRGYLESNIAPRMMRNFRVFRIFEGPTETLETQLGAEVVSGSKACRTLLEERFGQPELADHLEESVSAIVAAILERPGVASRSAARRIAYAHAGRLAAWVLLYGVLAQHRGDDDGAHRDAALQWIRTRMDEVRARALDVDRARCVLSSDEALQRAADLEAGLTPLQSGPPGFDWELDPALVDPLPRG